MRHRYAILGGVLLLAAVLAALGIWRFSVHLATPKPVVRTPAVKTSKAASESLEVNSSVDGAAAVLDELSELDADEMPLREVLELLSKRHQVPINLDKAAIGNVGVSPETPVTRHVSGIRLRSVLRLVLKELELTHGVHDGTIVVTTPEDWEGSDKYYISRDYLLKPLSGTYKANEEQIAHMVQATIEPQAWQTVSGRGEIQVLPGKLRIKQLPETHEQIGPLLARLAEAFNRMESEHDFSPIHMDQAGERHWRSIAKALRSQTSLDVVEQPLRDVISELSKRHGLSIQIDTKALDGVGVSSDTPVSRQTTGLSLRSTLNLVLHDLEIACLVKDDVLQITTPEVGEWTYSIRLYPIGDLLKSDPGIDSEALIDGILSIVPVSGWSDDNFGSIFHCAGCLVVSQRQEFDERCEAYLTNLRLALSQPTQRGVVSFPMPTTMIQKIETALAKPISLKCEHMPLGEVMMRLKEDLGIEVQLDIKAIDGSGFKLDMPITFKVENKSLAVALGELLAPHELHYRLQNEVLQITSREIADLTLESRWYPLRGLIGGPHGHTVEGIESLVREAMAKEPGEEYGNLTILSDVLVAHETRGRQDAIARVLRSLAEQ